MSKNDPKQVRHNHYMTQLDSLRAIAVVGVLVHHYHPESFLAQLQVGPLGVRLFFVLSGFLITGLLLKQKDGIENSAHKNIKPILKSFFLRRFIRLMPAYYLTILISYGLFSSIGSSPLWHLSYLSNIYFSFHDWDALTPHFWSLAVEAQFYLFWPFLIFRVSKREILWFIFSLIALAPLFRFIVVYWLYKADSNMLYIFPFASTDALGIGCLLGYLRHYQDSSSKTLHKHFLNVCIWIGFPSFALSYFIDIPQKYAVLIYTVLPLSACLCFALVIHLASIGIRGTIGRILDSAILRYLGKISYGIYLYHLVTWRLFAKVFSFLNISTLEKGWTTFFVCSILTVIVAALSWQLFERPINSLKDRFSY